MRLYLFFFPFFWELRISGNKQVSRERLEATGWWLGWLVLNFFPWYEEQFVLFCVESDHSFYLSGGNLRLEFQKKKCQTFTWNCKCMTLNREKKEVQNLKLWKKKGTIHFSQALLFSLILSFIAMQGENIMHIMI